MNGNKGNGVIKDNEVMRVIHVDKEVTFDVKTWDKKVV